MMEDSLVLIVDDSPETLLATRTLVIRAGYSVVEASTGRECMDQIRLHKPDVVLLDVMLPDANGLELARKIKSAPDTKNIFVVLVSGKMITPEDRTKGLSMGADGYITRPVSPSELEAQVHTFVRIKNTEKQLHERTLELAEVNRSLQAEIDERRKVQEELQRSETLLRIAGDLARLGGWSVNLKENRVIWSDQVAAIHDMPAGYSPTVDEGISFYAPEFRTRIKEIFAACAEQGTPYDEEMQIITAKGRRLWVRTMGVAEQDDSGRILSVYGGFQDVTDRRQMQEALLESENTFRSLFEKSPVSFIVHDKESGEIVDANQEACSRYGFSSVEELKTTIFWCEPPYSFDDALAWIRKAASQGRQHFEWLNKNASGDFFWEQVNLIPINISGKERVLAASIDITGLKKTEEMLRESELRFKTLHKASFGGVVMHDKGIILECNKGLCDITGYEYEELIGMNGLLLIAERDRKTAMDNILGGHERPYEVTGLRKNGEEYPVRLEARNIPFKGKQVRVTEFRDLTEIKQAEGERAKLQAQLFQAQKMESVGVLAGGIAHDFNNLLQAMKGNLELLDLKVSEGHPGKKRIITIHKSIGRAADLVRKLLFFSRKVETIRQKLDLNLEINESIKMLERTIPKMVKIEFFPDKDLYRIKADPVQVEQVLLNLCTNAADAMPEGGRLILETSNINLGKDNYMSLEPGPYVLMSLSDTGHGMEQKIREQAFDPFFTTKESGKGTGLGLASVYGIVKTHLGHINCYSEPGKGTTFKIYWPASSSETDIDVMKSNAPAVLNHQNETILVVDDDDDIRDLTEDVLKSYDYQVIAASSGEQALEIYSRKKESIDLILLDLNMPGMGGHKCLIELMKINPRVRVLITSGYSANGQVREPLKQGASGFIGKPYQINELLAMLRKLLD